MSKNNCLKSYNLRKKLIAINIILYLLAYLYAFAPFDAAKVYSDSADFITNVRIILLLFSFGIITANVNMILVNTRLNKNIVSLICTIIQIISLIYIGRIYKGAIGWAKNYGSQIGVDYCNKVMLMSIVIGIVVLASYILPLVCQKKISDEQYTDKLSASRNKKIMVIRIINVVVVVSLLIINVVLSYVRYEEDFAGNILAMMQYSGIWSSLLADILPIGISFFTLGIGLFDNFIKKEKYIAVSVICFMAVWAMENGLYFIYDNTVVTEMASKVFSGYKIIAIMYCVLLALLGLVKVAKCNRSVDCDR